MPELTRYVDRLAGTVDMESLKTIRRAAGFAGKDAAVTALVAAVGPDRALSNFRRGRPVRMSAGWDLRGATVVAINHRPKGLWVLADEGRKNSGRQHPRTGPSRNRKARKPTPGRAVLTPYGPRASSDWGPSRGLGVFRRAAALERREVPRAAMAALLGQIRSEVVR